MQAAQSAVRLHLPDGSVHHQQQVVLPLLHQHADFSVRKRRVQQRRSTMLVVLSCLAELSPLEHADRTAEPHSVSVAASIHSISRVLLITFCIFRFIYGHKADIGIRDAECSAGSPSSP